MIATEVTTLSRLFEDFRDDSKIWIYTSSRFFTEQEVEALNAQIAVFTREWTAHDIALKATGAVLFNRFIVLTVDESQTTASGCSIDKSAGFIRGVERALEVNLFDRLTIIYEGTLGLESFHLNEIKTIIDSGNFNLNTRIFDTTVLNLGALRAGFIKEAGKSWLKRFI